MEAPPGYVKSDEIYYFIWGRSGENKDDAIQRMQESGAIPAGVNVDDIRFISYSTTHSIYVPNEKNALSVVKKWRGEDGTELENPPGSVEVQLYQGCDGAKTVYGAPVILNAENDWSYTWENLPKADDAGKDYTYTVEETPLAGYTVTYNNNGGIQTGVIEITNTKTGYVLPETGGIGADRFIWLGLGLAGAALGGFYIQRIRRRGGRAAWSLKNLTGGRVPERRNSQAAFQSTSSRGGPT